MMKVACGSHWSSLARCAVLALLALSVACSPHRPAATASGSAGAPAAASSASPPVPAATGIQRYAGRTAAQLPPLVVPEWPAKIPGYTQLDPATGLHMTGEPVRIDVTTYRLKVTGAVRHPLSLSYDDLRMLPGIRSRATTICRGYFEDNAVWGGASLEEILRQAEPLESAKDLELRGADGYAATVTMAEAHGGDNYLAYELAGKPVPILHGFPLRAVFPSLYGNRWVKWLLEIKVE